MRALLRFLIGRRLARLLPGGWLAWLLLDPRVRRVAGRGASRLVARVQASRHGGPRR